MTDQVPGPSKPERTMLSIVDVAEELGCGRDTVYSLLASGQLRCRCRVKDDPLAPGEF